MCTSNSNYVGLCRSTILGRDYHLYPTIPCGPGEVEGGGGGGRGGGTLGENVATKERWPLVRGRGLWNKPPTMRMGLTIITLIKIHMLL